MRDLSRSAENAAELHVTSYRYLESPPRYQLLHCHRNRVNGGQSIWVDALHAAETFRTQNPTAFELLRTTDVHFWYVNDGHHLEKKHKTFVVDPTTQKITAVNYGPPFQAPLPFDTPEAFYPALQEFAALLRRPEGRFEHLLREGDLALFDNRRVLHARRAFSEREAQGQQTDSKEPNRLLRGCYVEADSIMDRIRILRTELNRQ